jgi:hypothetical protein
VGGELSAAQTTTWIFLADGFHQFASNVTGRSIPATFTKFFTLNLTEIFAKLYSVGWSALGLLSAA